MCVVETEVEMHIDELYCGMCVWQVGFTFYLWWLWHEPKLYLDPKLAANKQMCVCVAYEIPASLI